MKILLVALASGLLLIRAEANEERVLSTSPNGAFELVAIKHTQRDYEEYALRETKTKKPLILGEDVRNEFINTGFGGPTIGWSPDSRMLIISVKVYRDRGAFSDVFRIGSDLKLTQIGLRDDVQPVRWNRDGSLVVSVNRQETFKFDPKKQNFVPSRGTGQGK